VLNYSPVEPGFVGDGPLRWARTSTVGVGVFREHQQDEPYPGRSDMLAVTADGDTSAVTSTA
jgi:hypothetical protein